MSRRERLPKQEGILIKIGICFAERESRRVANEPEEIHSERGKKKTNTEENCLGWALDEMATFWPRTERGENAARFELRTPANSTAVSLAAAEVVTNLSLSLFQPTGFITVRNPKKTMAKSLHLYSCRVPAGAPAESNPGHLKIPRFLARILAGKPAHAPANYGDTMALLDPDLPTAFSTKDGQEGRTLLFRRPF